MKIKKTYMDLFIFEKISNSYRAQYLTKTEGVESYLTKQILNVLKQISAHQIEFDDLVESIKDKNCMKVPDGIKKGAILYDEIKLKDAQGAETATRIRCFTADGNDLVRSEVKKLSDQTVEIHSRIAEGIDDLIASLNETELEVFSGVVIPEQKAKKEE